MISVDARPHVLLVSYYYPPSNEAASKRALGFHRHLSEWGYRSTLITIEPETGIDSLEKNVVRVKRQSYRQTLARVAPSTGRRYLARLYHEFADIPDGYRSFFAPAVAAGMEISERDPVSAVLATSSPYTSLRVGATLSRELRVPWMADLRDLWTASHFGYPHGRLRRVLDRWLERRWLRTAGRIITATQGLADVLSASGLAFKGRTVHNGFLEQMPYRPAPTGPFRVSFLGRLYEGADHSPQPFFEALRCLWQGPPVDIRVDFFGSINQEFAVLRKEMALESVVAYRGQVSADRASELAMEADLLLVLLPDKPSQSVTVPTKLFDYAATRRPVLFIGPDGEGARLVRDAGLGRAFRANEIPAIAAWMAELVSRKNQGLAVAWGDVEKVAGFHYRWRSRDLAGELTTMLGEGQ